MDESASRLHTCQKTIYNVTYTTGYNYDLAGDPTQITYPSGRVLSLNNDSVGRLMAAQNHSTQGNDKGTLSDEQGRKPVTTTRERARRINNLTFGVVTAGWRFESSAAHHFPFVPSRRSASC